MSFYPHSRLIPGPSCTVVVSGPHVQIVNTQSGEIVHTTCNLVNEEKDALLKSGPVRCAAVDAGFSHFITTGDDKTLKVWRIDGLKLLSARELPKKPTEIAFTRDGDTIVVSDKFGDIFSYPLHPDTNATPESRSLVGASKRGALTSHENPSNGTLVLGHVSFVICFLLSPDEKYIITADRDEHIRISWYPQGYNIESYCLGQEKFVSAIHIPPFAPASLVSGGGDPVLKLWDWMTGTLQSEIPILDAVKPFIKVQAPKGKWGREDGEDEDGGAAAETARGRKKKRGKKGKDKGQEKEEDKGEDEARATPEVETEAVDAAGEEVPGQQEVEMAEQAEAEAGTSRAAEEGQGTPAVVEEEKTGRFVLVVHKIQTIDQGTHGRFLVFSAVGATALFYCPYPEATSAAPPTVHHVKFERPVIDFTSDAAGLVWVLMDAAWNNNAGKAEEEAADKTQLVRVLSWASGEPAEMFGDDAPPLLSSLQSACVIPATSDDLKKLDIYSALGSLPKNVDPEHDPLRRDILVEATAAERASAPQGKDKGNGKRKDGVLTLREKARLKKKRALAEKLQKEAADSATPEPPGGDADERESKRAKSESNIGDDVQDSNAMDES